MRRPRIDCLFVHAGKTAGGRHSVLIMPMGLAALADLLDRSGVRSRVLNLPLALIRDPGFSLPRFAARAGVRVLCLPLHWHGQTAAVLETARSLKAAAPGVPVVLGGFTATALHAEIMARWRCVDFVVRGDAERPLAELVPRLLSGARDFSDVPNLCWRAGRTVRVNPRSYAGDRRALDALRFGRLELILNRRDCLRGRWRLEDGQTAALDSGPRWFFYNPGRGCAWDCSFCGGCRQAQGRLNGRGVVWKSAACAAADLADAWDNGARHWYACFDPDPRRSFYRGLFRRLRARRLAYGLTFECWSLPDRGFLEAARAAFPGGAEIVLSPETGSETVRARNKGPTFSNVELAEAMGRIQAAGLETTLFFTSGLPGEGMRDFARTLQLIRALRARFRFGLSAHAIEAEPLSLISSNPRRYGVRLRRRTLEHYLAASRTETLGYATTRLSEARIWRNIELLRRFPDFWDRPPAAPRAGF